MMKATLLLLITWWTTRKTEYRLKIAVIQPIYRGSQIIRHCLQTTARLRNAARTQYSDPAKIPTSSKSTLKSKDEEKRGFIERAPDAENGAERVHYIPHHGVKKESSTTQVRLCTTVAAACHLWPSVWMTGLNLHHRILMIYQAFFWHFGWTRFAISTDIQKAFCMCLWTWKIAIKRPERSWKPTSYV